MAKKVDRSNPKVDTVYLATKAEVDRKAAEKATKDRKNGKG